MLSEIDSEERSTVPSSPVELPTGDEVSGVLRELAENRTALHNVRVRIAAL